MCPAPSVERRLLRIPAHIYAPGRRNARHASASTDQPGERLQRHPGKAARTRPAASPKKLKDGDAQQPRQPPAVGEPQPAVVGESIQGAGAGAGAEQWRGRARRLPPNPQGRRPGQRRGVGKGRRTRVPAVNWSRRRLPVAAVPRPQVRRGRTSSGRPAHRPFVEVIARGQRGGRPAASFDSEGGYCKRRAARRAL